MSLAQISFNMDDPNDAKNYRIADKSRETHVALMNFEKWLSAKKTQEVLRSHEVLTKLRFELESRGVFLNELENNKE